MLTQIHIENFKGFKNTTIKPLRKVNLIVGGQNVGKTSVLEAVYLGAANVGSFQTVAALFRVAEGRDNQRYVDSVLGKQSRSIELSAKGGIVLRTGYNAVSSATDSFALQGLSVGNVNEGRSIRGPGVVSDHIWSLNALNGRSDDLFTPMQALEKISFLDPLAVSIHLPNQVGQVQMFDQAVLGRKKRVLLEMLRRIEPRLEDLHSLSPDSEQRIYVELTGEEEALPLPQLGHGFNRLVYLYCSLLVTNAKLALMDEVENGIHYSALPILFRGIQDVAAKHGVQTLMTTHSWDCIRAAYQTFADANALSDFQLIRLERDQDNVRAVVINDEALDTVMEAGYEVR